MSSLIAAILALAKVAPIMERFLDSLVEGYRTYRLEKNNTDEKQKNDRDADLIDAAGKQLHLCASCPFARNSGGQHSEVVATPAVPVGGSGSA